MKKKTWLFSVPVVALAGIGAFFLYPRSKPQYPQYCWLAFGPEAKVRVLVCFDGRALYIDRDGDRQFTGPEERFSSVKECKDVVIADGVEKTSYIITETHYAGLTRPPWTMLIFHVDIKGPLEYRQVGDVDMATEPDNAPVAHFHGPLRIHATPKARSWEPPRDPITLHIGEKPTELYANISTWNDEDNPNGGAAVRVEVDGRAIFPQGIHPFVDVEFSPQRQGDVPIRKRYPLNKVC